MRLVTELGLPTLQPMTGEDDSQVMEDLQTVRVMLSLDEGDETKPIKIDFDTLKTVSDEVEEENSEDPTEVVSSTHTEAVQETSQGMVENTDETETHLSAITDIEMNENQTEAINRGETAASLDDDSGEDV